MGGAEGREGRPSNRWNFGDKGTSMLEYLLASTLYTGEESLPSSRNRVCRAPGAARRVFLDILVTSRQNHGRQAKRLGPDSSTGAGAGSGVAGGGHLEKKKKPEN